jgi:hypothetical protein
MAVFPFASARCSFFARFTAGRIKDYKIKDHLNGQHIPGAFARAANGRDP